MLHIAIAFLGLQAQEIIILLMRQILITFANIPVIHVSHHFKISSSLVEPASRQATVEPQLASGR